MRKVFGLVLIAAVSVLAAGEGRVENGLKPPDQQQASMADWYTMKTVHISITGSGKTILNIDSTWSGYLLKGFINQSTATTAAVKVITQVGDTTIIPIPPAGFIWKLPIIAKLFTTGTSDSLVYMFQKK